jgi:APA family basic amino acid/polyamine antiporter
VAGIIIGAAIFVQPSEVSRHVASVPAISAVWLVAGVLTLAGALVCARLARQFPRSGGVYVYLKETISPAVGFLWGWANFWIVHSGIIAAISVIVARYAGYFVTLDAFSTRVVAIAAILVLSGVNYAGVRAGGTVQTALTAAKIAAILVLLVLAFFVGKPHQQESAAVSPITLSGFLLGVSAGLVTYGGWHMVTYAAGEIRDPVRTIPRALLIGVLLVTVCYVGLNLAYLWVLPVPAVLASTRVAADAAEAIVGARGAGFVSGLVIVSALGALNGVILAGPRLYLAMAEDRLWFRGLAAIHPRLKTPHRAIVAQAIWASVLVASGTYRELFTRVVYTEWLFFGLMSWGLLRTREPGSKFVPLIFILACAAIVGNHIFADPLGSGQGLLFVALGIPVYFIWTRHANR